MSKSGRFTKKTATGKSRKTLLIVICVLLILVLGGCAAAGAYANNMLKGVNHVEVAEIDYTKPAAEETAEQASAPAEADSAEAAETAAQTETAAATEAAVISRPEDFENYLIVCKPVKKDGSFKQTDTMILCTLNRRTKTMTLTSLLKNALVETPAYNSYSGGEATLNTVYGIGATYGKGTAGSMELLNRTLYHNFGIEIDRNFELDMLVLANIITRLEDVNIELSEAEATYLSEATGKTIGSGAQIMDGALAREYIYMWADENAEGIDILTGQKKLLESIVHKVRTQYVDDLDTIVKDIMPSITTSMDFVEFREFLASLLPMIRNLSVENGGTCPAEYQEAMLDADGNGTEEAVLTFDAAQATKIMRAITKGEK